jgi:hypothetical protein
MCRQRDDYNHYARLNPTTAAVIALEVKDRGYRAYQGLPGSSTCGGAEHGANRSGDPHRECSPEYDPSDADQRSGTAGARSEPAQDSQAQQRRDRYAQYQTVGRREERNDQWQRSADRECQGGRECGLHRARGQCRGDTQLVAGMSGQGVLGHELCGYLSGEGGRQAASDVDCRELLLLGRATSGQLPPLPLQIGSLGVGLGADRDVFTGGHGHGTRHQPGNSRDQNGRAAGLGRRDPEHQTRRGDDPIVGAEDGGPKPADALGAMLL